MSSVTQLKLLGQSIWYDNITRSLIEDGSFRKMIERREIFGVTSNPSIFESAIKTTQNYHGVMQTMSWVGLSAKEMFYRVAIEDIRNVADLFRPYYDATNGSDGYVSLEVNPDLADDTENTIAEAKWLWKEVNRPNLMIKIPATKAGLPAITEVIAAGINVNVTLIFSRKRYEEVMDAYLSGLEKRLERGEELANIASVASFFVSRFESKADQRLQKVVDQGGDKAEIAKELIGRIAVDNTRLAYQAYESFFDSKRFKKLADAGAQRQRPLWASTSTKNPDYSDIKYVEELVAENSINTIPPETLAAFIDHGDPKITIHDDIDRAEEDFKKLDSLGISIDEITQELEDEGVRKFAESFKGLLQAIETQRKAFVKELGSLEKGFTDAVRSFEKDGVVSRIFRNDPTVWTNDAGGKAEIQKRLGWLDLPFESEYLLADLNDFSKQCLEDGIEKVLLLGMGGSSLSPETMSLIFKGTTEGAELKILDSTVPAQVKEAEDWVDYGRTLFIVGSKSGTTSETMSLFHYFWEQSKQVLGEGHQTHFVAITDPGSKLAEMGNALRFRRVFTANPNVGGRYSALTHFGLVPAALMGIDLKRLIEEAQKAAKMCAPSREIDLNLGALLGIYIGLGYQSGRDKLTFLTDESLKPLGAWLEQLVAESSGKEGMGIVPVVDEPIIKAGAYSGDRVFVYLRNTGDLDGFVENIKKNEHPCIVLEVSGMYSLAAQFYLWEFAVAVACSIIGVNAFDQPDVQDSKDRTKKMITAFLEEGKLREPDVVWARDGVKVFGTDYPGLSESNSLQDVIDGFIALAEDGDYIGINAYLSRNEKTQSALQGLRQEILEKTGKVTTLGFGPRFQHSTGQLHKGGANNGLFLQITQENAEDIDIPNEAYSFGVLARAQALGDLEALRARERRVIRIHLPADHALDFDL